MLFSEYEFCGLSLDNTQILSCILLEFIVHYFSQYSTNFYLSYISCSNL